MRRGLIVFLYLAMHNILYAQPVKLPVKKEKFHFFHAKHFDFVENKGQWQSQIGFHANLHQADVWFETDRITFALLDPEQLKEFFRFKAMSWDERQRTPVPSGIIDAHAYQMIFLGSNAQVETSGSGVLPHHLNFYIGNDPQFWASEVRLYDKVIYNDLYSGIDLIIYENEGFLKHDFVVEAGSDPGQLKFEIAGAEKVDIIDDHLVISTKVNKISHLKPFAYQMIGGKVVEVPCRFNLKKNIVTYEFPDGYNQNIELIIDPVWVFGSYSGSTADNWGYTATYDADGNLYAGGNVFNNGYPLTTGAYQVNFAGGSCDIGISKYNSAGSVMLYSTYLGGSGAEVPHSMMVNNQNELYVYGSTGSANFPMAGNSYDNSFGGGVSYTLTNIIHFTSGSDIALARFSSDGTQLLGSTYIGGSGNDGLNMFIPLRNNYADDCRGEIHVDANDNVYVVSTTASTNFPVTPGVFQTSYAGGDLDGCVFKMDNSLSTMIWSTYLGGSGIDAVYSIALDKFDNPVVAGGTTSNNFPVSPGSVKPSYQGGTCDGFATRISKNGDQIMRSSFWGTDVYDQVYFVELDKQNNIYLLGQTRDANSSLHVSATWWTPGGGQFISKLNSNMTSVNWSTIFGTGGGTVNISPTAFLVDYCNNIYLSGWGSPSLNGFGGTSGMPVTSNAFQSTTDNNDYYFMSITDDASSLVFASFYGGSSAEHVDGGTSRFDRMGKIYQGVCAGCGGWDDFPTSSGAWSNTNNSTNCNMGAVKIDFELPAIVAEFISNAPVCLPEAVQFSNTSYIPNPGSTSCFWDFGDGTTSTNCNPTHVFPSSGLYTVMLIMSDPGSCNQSDTVWHQVLVLSNSTDTIPDAHMCQGSFTQIGILPYVGAGITYQWLPASNLSNSTISNPICTSPVTTIYTLLVSDGVCTDTLTQRVNVYNIQVDAGSDTLICTLNHTLSASATGAPDLQYQWSSDNQFSNWLNTSPNDNVAIVNVSGPAWYYVMAYNQWCYDIDSIYVDFLNIGAGFTPVLPQCFDDCNGMLTVNPYGGNAPYNYVWSNGDSTQTISDLCAGNYVVTVTDVDGCEVLAQFDLEQPPPMEMTYLVTPVPCEVACNGIIDIVVTGGTPDYEYLWNNGQTTSSATGLCQGDYVVTVTDDHLCEVSQSFSVLVDLIYENVNVWTDDDTLWDGQSTGLHATSIPGVNYNWSPETWLSDPGSSSTTATPPPGTYWYYVVLDDGNGCVYTDSVKIIVIDVFCYDPYLFFPNAFSPDGDGINDILYARGIYIEEMELLIFDRWGNLVFESYNPANGWDGTYNNKLCDPDVYAYYLKILCFNKVYYIKKGNITLIR